MVQRHLRTFAVVTGLLAVSAVALRAQDGVPRVRLGVGVLELYDVERRAPQFIEARATLASLQEDAAATVRAAEQYTMLEPEEFERALALERVRDVAMTREQRAELDLLRRTDDERNGRFRGLLQLPPEERTPETDAEFERLRKLYDACAEHRTQLTTAVQTELEQKERSFREKLAAELDAALARVAEAKGIETIVQRSVRTVSPNIETGQPVVEYHRIVHYGGTDVTDDVVAELTRANDVERGLPSTPGN